MMIQEKDLDRLAAKIAVLVKAKEKKVELVTAREAAKILGISRSRMYHIKDRYPYVKTGDAPQSRILFIKERLL